MLSKVGAVCALVIFKAVLYQLQGSELFHKVNVSKVKVLDWVQPR
jgi:hypothetical protein